MAEVSPEVAQQVQDQVANLFGRGGAAPRDDSSTAEEAPQPFDIRSQYSGHKLSGEAAQGASDFVRDKLGIPFPDPSRPLLPSWAGMLLLAAAGGGFVYVGWKVVSALGRAAIEGARVAAPIAIPLAIGGPAGAGVAAQQLGALLNAPVPVDPARLAGLLQAVSPAPRAAAQEVVVRGSLPSGAHFVVTDDARRAIAQAFPAPAPAPSPRGFPPAAGATAGPVTRISG